MKAEQFDHYVRAQFENDAVAPPARLEGAVFAALDGQQQGRKRMLGAAALVLTVASSAALWVGTRPVAEEARPVSNAAIETAAVEAQTAPEPAPASVVLPVEQPAQPEKAAVESVVAAPVTTQPSPPSDTKAPGTLETVEARTIDGVSVESPLTGPELQQTNKETWVLPAVVKVND